MRHTMRKLAAGAVLLLAIGSAGLAFGAPVHQPAHKSSKDEALLRMEMRRLWQDHTLWTRLVIVSTAADLGDLQPTTDRLLRNQSEIGNAIKPFYGGAAGDKLTSLLRSHIQGAAEVLAAAKAKDSARLDRAKRDWFANADEIAAFLGKANPRHWPTAEMKSMMHEHLNLTLTEATDQLQGRYSASVADYDRVQGQILKMADMLSDGIARQFPSRIRQLASAD